MHKVVSEAVAPVRVRQADCYITKCSVSLSDTIFEVSDIPEIVAKTGEGTGVFVNPCGDHIEIFHLGNALCTGPKKINKLPSACDLIVTDQIKKELILVELTESNPRSLLGVSGARNPGKFEKARNQLKSTIDIIKRVGCIQKPALQSAIIFFRLPIDRCDVAARSFRAFSLNPALSRVTKSMDQNYPDWIFYSYPYPNSHII